MERKLPPAVSRTNAAPPAAPLIPRRFARAAVDLPAQYAIDGESGWHASVIDDLGGGGVRLQTDNDVAAGTIVTLRFDIGGTPIAATARVAMSLYDQSRSRYIHGVAFTSIEPEQRQAIVQRVDALQARTT